MSDRQVYDFEAIVETAVKALLTGYELNAFTTQDEPDFQTDRPRVEVSFVRGAGQMRWAARSLLPAALQSERIESAWKAGLKFDVIVTPDAAGRGVLADYRCKLRKIIPNLAKLLNGTATGLQFHAVRLPHDTGDARVIDTDKGYEMLTITMEIDFSINANAWALLDP